LKVFFFNPLVFVKVVENASGVLDEGFEFSETNLLLLLVQNIFN